MKHSLIIIFSVLLSVMLLSCKGGRSGNNPSADEKNSAQNQNPTVISPGEQLYSKYCLTCHQPDGNGMKTMFPPLAGNQKITGPADELITIVLFGLEGPIIVNGQEQTYNQAMPAQDYLTDQQIADVLTYIRSSWKNKATPVSVGEVAEIRKKRKIN